jgi:hypothetical protein
MTPVVMIKLLDKRDRLYKNENKKKLWLVYCTCFNTCNGIQTFMILITWFQVHLRLDRSRGSLIDYLFIDESNVHVYIII